MPPNVSSESIRRGEVDMIFVCGHMQVKLTYACIHCLVAGTALTVWDAKSPSLSKGHRWGCLNCLGNWDRESSAAVAINLVMDGKSLSFYSY